MKDEILKHRHVQRLIAQAIEEDVGAGDVTCRVGVDPGDRGAGRVVAREDLVACGTALAAEVFRRIEPGLAVEVRVEDGHAVPAGAVLLEVSGPVAGMLTAERTALNFLQRLSGVATLTRRYVDAVAGTGAVILDTRKTTPGYRLLEKYAVRCGGGRNHRMGLYDRIMLKDNHLASWRRRKGGGLADLVRAARAAAPGVELEVEVETPEELEEVLAAAPDWVLLDNMPAAMLRDCVARCAGRARLEASGGVTLARVAEIAATGVDAISVGALTHSAPAVDIALDWKVDGESSH